MNHVNSDNDRPLIEDTPEPGALYDTPPMFRSMLDNPSMPPPPLPQHASQQKFKIPPIPDKRSGRTSNIRDGSQNDNAGQPLHSRTDAAVVEHVSAPRTPDKGRSPRKTKSPKKSKSPKKTKSPRRNHSDSTPPPNLGQASRAPAQSSSPTVANGTAERPSKRARPNLVGGLTHPLGHSAHGRGNNMSDAALLDLLPPSTDPQRVFNAPAMKQVSLDGDSMRDLRPLLRVAEHVAAKNYVLQPAQTVERFQRFRRSWRNDQPDWTAAADDDKKAETIWRTLQRHQKEAYGLLIPKFFAYVDRRGGIENFQDPLKQWYWTWPIWHRALLGIVSRVQPGNYENKDCWMTDYHHEDVHTFVQRGKHSCSGNGCLRTFGSHSNSSGDGGVWSELADPVARDAKYAADRLLCAISCGIPRSPTHVVSHRCHHRKVCVSLHHMRWETPAARDSRASCMHGGPFCPHDTRCITTSMRVSFQSLALP